MAVKKKRIRPIEELPPTKQRIRRVQNKVIESKGKLPISVAMVQEGYSPKSAHNPQIITKSKTWQESLEIIDNNEVLQRVNDLIRAKSKLKTYIKGDLTTEIEEMDSFAVSKGIDFAAKFKGLYKPTQVEVRPYQEMDDEQLAKLASGGLSQ